MFGIKDHAARARTRGRRTPTTNAEHILAGFAAPKPHRSALIDLESLEGYKVSKDRADVLYATEEERGREDRRAYLRLTCGRLGGHFAPPAGAAKTRSACHPSGSPTVGSFLRLVAVSGVCHSIGATAPAARCRLPYNAVKEGPKLVLQLVREHAKKRYSSCRKGFATRAP